jgi:hypothetical protein
MSQIKPEEWSAMTTTKSQPKGQSSVSMESQNANQPTEIKLVKLGQVAAEVSLYANDTHMVSVGQPHGIDGGISNIEVFVHFDKTGKFLFAHVWDGVQWVEIKPNQAVSLMALAGSAPTAKQLKRGGKR